MPIFQERFFFGKEKINCFGILKCYYSHLKDRKNICLKKFHNLLLLLWLFEVGASQKSAWVARVILTLEDI